jgi:hypothetical protein
MSRVPTLALLALSTSLTLQGQTFQKAYGQTHHNQAKGIAHTDDGYIIVGQTYDGSFDNPQDIYVVKTDELGNRLWSKTYGSTLTEDGIDVEHTADGGYVILGRTEGFGAWYNDYYLFKIDADGDTLWSRMYGSHSDDDAIDLEQTADGGFALFGTSGITGTSRDFYLVKTDAEGDTTWTHTYGLPYDDLATGFRQTSDGGYIMLGDTRTGPGESYHMLLVKADATGALQWARRIYTEFTSQSAGEVMELSTGGYGVAGAINSSNHADGCLLLFDTEGDTLWTRSYRNANSTGLYRMDEAPTGLTMVGSINTGNPYNDLYAIRTDLIGNLQRSKVYGGPGLEQLPAFVSNADGGLTISGYTGSFGGTNGNVYLVRADSTLSSGCHEGDTTLTQGFAPLNYEAVELTFSHGGDVGYPHTVMVPITDAVYSECSAMGMREEQEHRGMTIAPNPAQNEVTIGMRDNNGPMTIDLLNATGQIIHRIAEPTARPVRIPVISFEPGLYVVRVNDGNGSICGRLIVE